MVVRHCITDFSKILKELKVSLQVSLQRDTWRDTGTRTGPAGHSERRSRNREKTGGGKLNLNVTMQNFQETVGDTLNLNVIGLEEREQQLIARK